MSNEAAWSGVAVPAWAFSWCAATGLLAAGLAGQDGHAESRRAEAVREGIAYLVGVQEDDGGMPAPAFRHDRFADTALAALAMLAAGERLDGGEHHPALRSAVRWLQTAIPEEGPLRVGRPRPHQGWQRFETWYVAFAGLLFVELHQQAPSDDLKATLQRLRRRLVALQKPTGGWCHDLQPKVRQVPGFGTATYADDLCAVGCLCVAVLDGMRRAGIDADDEVFHRGLCWLLALQNEDGGFAYGKGHVWPDAVLSEPGRSAGSLFALLPLLGRDDPRCRRAAAYLDGGFAGLPLSAGHLDKPFIISYLGGALCCARWGPAATRRFLDVHTRDLLAHRSDDGSIQLGTGLSDTQVLGTAIAVTCLLGERSALGCARPVATDGDPAAATAQWLLDHRTAEGVLDGRWGDMSVDLALTGIAARALGAFDPLGHGDTARRAARWAASEVAGLHGQQWRTDRRSHLGFQLPLLLPLLLDHRADPDVAIAAQRVVDELVATQWPDGGWSYDRDHAYSLISTTAPVAIALADARRAGLEVPPAVIEKAADYVEACQGEGGGFRYCPDPTHPILARDKERYLREEVPRTVVAVAALAAVGRDGAAAYERGIAFLQRELGPDSLPEDDRHLWFSLLWGDRLVAPGELRSRWDRLVRARLDSLRADDGGQSWPGIAWSAGLSKRPPMYPVFATAAALALRVAPARRE